MLWKNKGRADVFVPLPRIEQVQVIRMDGSRRVIHAGGKGITLGVSEDPLLLLYKGGGTTLAQELGTPVATLSATPNLIARREPVTLTVVLNGASAEGVKLIAPPFWTVKKDHDGGPATVRFTLSAPPTSSIREVDLIVTLDDGKGNRQGELFYRAPLAD